MRLATLSRRLMRMVRPFQTVRQRRLVRLAVRGLEPRIVLNADVGFVGNQVQLDNFTGPGAAPGVTIIETTHDFGAGNVAAYKFTLNDLGDWNQAGLLNLDGAGGDDAEGDGADLYIDKDFLDNIATAGLQINDTNDVNPNVVFGNAGGLDFSAVDVVDLQGVNNVTQGGKLQTADFSLNAADVTLTNAANDFQGVVSVTAAGAVQLVDANTLQLGPVANAKSLTATATTISVQGNIQTLDAQTFNGAVQLTPANVTFSSTNNQNITFNGAVTGVGSALTVNTTGTTAFNGNVSTKSLTTNAGGTTAFGAGVTTVTTAGAQQYGDNVTTANANVTFESTGNDAITFKAKLTGAASNISVNTTGATTFQGAVSASKLTTNAGGTTSIGASVTTTGAQAYNDDVTITGAATLTTTNSAVTFAESLTLGADLTISAGTGAVTFGGVVQDDGVGGTTSNLAVNSTGATTFQANVGQGVGKALTSLTTNAGGTTVFGAAVASITTTGKQEYGDNVTTANADVAFTSTGNGAVSFKGQFTGAGTNLTVNTGGATSFLGAVSAASLTTNAGGTTTIGANVTTTGAQSYGDAVTTTAAIALATTDSAVTFNDSLTLGGDLTINAGAGAATFTGVVQDDGVGGTTSNLTVNSTVATKFQSAVGQGANKALTSLTTNAGGTTSIGASVTTTGAQAYNDDVTITGAATLTTTNSAVSFAKSLTLAADLTISAGTGAVTFKGAVQDDGVAGTTSNLTVNTTGATTFLVNVGEGANKALTSLTTNAGGTTAFGAAVASITTSGKQEYGDNVTTANADVAFTSTGNGAVSFKGQFTGAGTNLTVNTGGATSFLGTVNAKSATTDAGGTTTISADVTTTGEQTYNDAVTVSTNPVTLKTTNSNVAFNSTLTLAADLSIVAGTGAVTFKGAVQDDGVAGTKSNLTVDASGDTTFQAAVGVGGALTSLTTTGGGNTLINGGAVTTSGAQTYNDAVLLGANTTLTTSGAAGTGDVLFDSTVDGAFALTVNTTGGGTTTFKNDVGSGTALASLTTDLIGATEINGGKVTTTGAQTYNDAVTLGANTVLTTSNNAVVVNPGNVTFASTLDGGFSLNVNTTGGGTTTFGGKVGNSTALASLTTDKFGQTFINGGEVTTTGAQTYGDAVTVGTNNATLETTAAGGDVTFDQSVTLAKNLTVQAAVGNVLFNGTVDGASALVVNTPGGGNTTFQDAVGGTTPLASLTTDAGGATFINGGKVATSGAQSYNDIVTVGVKDAVLSTTNNLVSFADLLTLAANLTINAGSGAVTFTGEVVDDGAAGTPSNLVVNSTGITTFQAAVGQGAGNALDSLATNAGGTTHINGGQITTTGSQTYGDPVTLGANTTLTTSGAAGNVSFNSTLSGAFSLNVNTTGGGTTTFGGGVNLLSLETDNKGKTVISGGSVTTTTFQTYGDPVLVGAGAQKLTAGTDIQFLGTIDGGAVGQGDLQIVNAQSTTFSSPVGGTTPLNTFKATSDNITFQDNAYVVVNSGADNSVHIVANGALSLGAGFHVKANLNAGQYDAVATTFVPVPEPGKSNTALYDSTTVPAMIAAIASGVNQYVATFQFIVGQGAQAGKGPNGTELPAEQGLQVYMDWGDTVIDSQRFEGPAAEGWPTGESTLSGLTGGTNASMKHTYTDLDVQNQLLVGGDDTFDGKFAVSHHPSIVIEAKQLTQNGVTVGNVADPLRVFTTTYVSADNSLPQFIGGKGPDDLVNGEIEIQVTYVQLPPFIEPMAPPTPQMLVAPAIAPPPPVVVLTNIVSTDDPVPSSTVSVRRHEFILRALSPDPEPEVLGEERLNDDDFQADRLQRLFMALPDGAYDIILRTGDGQDRPIIRFDIRSGRPVVPEEPLDGGQLRLEEIQEAIRESQDTVQTEDADFDSHAAAAPPPDAPAVADAQVAADAGKANPTRLATSEHVEDVGAATGRIRVLLRTRGLEEDNPLGLARRLARRAAW
ncbi:MAG: hypothetical protein KF774_15775 [Planctomyces sp.]|nr:hypothetical protein [Planctomyces sp.]